MTSTARVPLDEVKRHPHGRLYDEAEIRVEPREEGNTDRLQLGAPYIMEWLRRIRARTMQLCGAMPNSVPAGLAPGQQFPQFHRPHQPGAEPGEGYNPLYVHPDDLSALAWRTETASRSDRRTTPFPAWSKRTIPCAAGW